MSADDQPTTPVRIGTFRDGRPAFMTVRRRSLLELFREGVPLFVGRARWGKSRPPYAAYAALAAAHAPSADSAATADPAPEQPVDPHPRT
ncbi:hypothetical protein [Streptomyces sp. H27-C3]|uniref:hypothetical protein n=1 Tax=Streptomyces sp. H27-C3 TaxID=3046305 RepID=UPI0024BB6C7D|nr:hypothetical protein [Streptomyces sp. H27-C3]MDJ0465028.1 hypothetical protein [Streptomyces sp. H27-C3]